MRPATLTPVSSGSVLRDLTSQSLHASDVHLSSLSIGQSRRRRQPYLTWLPFLRVPGSFLPLTLTLVPLTQHRYANQYIQATLAVHFIGASRSKLQR